MSLENRIVSDVLDDESTPSTPCNNEDNFYPCSRFLSVSLTETRKKVVLDLPKKLEIVKLLREGESASRIAPLYGIGRTTVNDIKKNADKLVEYALQVKTTAGDIRARKTMKRPGLDKLDAAMYEWYVGARQQGLPLSGPIIMAKAAEMNGQIGGDKSFKASTGWLGKFKSRHGIRHADLAATTPEKRKKVVLSLHDKLEVVKRLRNGESASYIAREYGIGRTTVIDIKKSGDKLEQYALNLQTVEGDPKTRKTMKKLDKTRLKRAAKARCSQLTDPDPEGLQWLCDEWNRPEVPEVITLDDSDNDTDHIVSDGEAASMLTEIIKWFEIQEEANDTLMTLLRAIYQIASEKARRETSLQDT